jgi:hypothetical protein
MMALRAPYLGTCGTSTTIRRPFPAGSLRCGTTSWASPRETPTTAHPRTRAARFAPTHMPAASGSWRRPRCSLPTGASAWSRSPLRRASGGPRSIAISRPATRCTARWTSGRRRRPRRAAWPRCRSGRPDGWGANAPSPWRSRTSSTRYRRTSCPTNSSPRRAAPAGSPSRCTSSTSTARTSCGSPARRSFPSSFPIRRRWDRRSFPRACRPSRSSSASGSPAASASRSGCAGASPGCCSAWGNRRRRSTTSPSRAPPHSSSPTTTRTSSRRPGGARRRPPPPRSSRTSSRRGSSGSRAPSWPAGCCRPTRSAATGSTSSTTATAPGLRSPRARAAARPPQASAPRPSEPCAPPAAATTPWRRRCRRCTTPSGASATPTSTSPPSSPGGVRRPAA